MTIESTLRRAFPVLVLMLLGVAAYLQARGLMQLVGLALWAEGKSSPPTPPPARSARAPAKTANAVLQRNPFDAQTGPLVPSLDNSTAPAPAPTDPLLWPTCRDVQVVIVSESRDPWWSLTSMREPGEQRAHLRRVGDRVAGKQVAFIGFNPREQVPAVWLVGDDVGCQAALFRAAMPTVTTSPATTHADARPSRLARANVEVLSDPKASLRSIRVVPEQRNGVVVGLRLFGIRPGSLLSSVGIQNGDRLESINGFSMTTPTKALEAYAHLVRARRLDVHLVRAGAPLDLRLNID